MLKTRVIPTLLWKDVGLVKGQSFNSWRRVGTVLPAIKVYNVRDVDELILLDISSTPSGQNLDYKSISEFSKECFVPLTVGGGVNSIDRFSELLRYGADKVAINTAAYLNPQLITQAADLFGIQCIVVSIDARQGQNGIYECLSHCGTRPTGKEPGNWAKEMEDRGAGEILITSIDNDGTMNGYDLNLVKRVTSQVSIPVIASGGAGNYQHMFDVIDQTRVSAVAAASIFHFTQHTPIEAKRFLSLKGVPVRISKEELELN